jgi:monovalent cation:H+ antiporter-2, CPA2 family
MIDPGPWLKDVLVFLAAAGIIVPLFHRARIGGVLAFLFIGVVVGPYGFGQHAADFPWLRYLTIEHLERVEILAELGVIFLLFLIGLELSLTRLWELRRYVIGVGGLQFTLSVLVIGSGLTALGTPVSAAIVLGLGLAMSSTAIVMQLLEDEGRSTTPVGRIALSVLLFQDLMVAPVLFVVGVLARGGDDVGFALAGALLQAAAAVAIIVAVGHYLLRPLFRLAGQTGSRELIMAMALFTVIGLAAATGRAGLSAALGAFLAGLLLSETEYRHQIDIDLAPFKGLLIGLFFISVGMLIDVRALWRQIDLILAAVLALLALKGVILFAASRLLAVRAAAAAEVAVLLAQAGEFAFVVITLASATGLMASETAHLAAAVVALSMVATPLCAYCGRWLGRRMQHLDHGHHLPNEPAELCDHVVIGGYGRVGQMISRLLVSENVPFVALDDNGELVTERRKLGHPVYFGDAGRRELLERVGAAHARAFVVTVDAPKAAERMVDAARSAQPEALVFARAIDATHAARLLELGAVGVIPEAVEASLQLAARLLEGLGFSREMVAERLAEMRERERARLRQARKDTT